MRKSGLGSNRIFALLTALLLAVGLTGMTTIAIAEGGSGSGHHHHHHHHKKCPKGTHKKVFFKHGKKHRKCVPNKNDGSPNSPSPASAGLVINPTTFAFPPTQHGGFPCMVGGCSTQDFTVKNAGGKASGALSASIAEVHNPEIGGPPAFQISPNGCTAALAPGASCTLTVQFAPNSNAGDEHYTSVLHVAASPGGDATAQLSGDAQ